MTTHRFADAPPPAGARRLNLPNPLWGSNGIAFGPDGRLHVAQFLYGQISALDTSSGDVEVIVEHGGPVQSPDDLAFGADGSMYIADLVPGLVWRRSPQGAYTLVSDEVKLPNGITCVGDRLFVNEMRPGGRLFELFPDGRQPVVLAEGLAMGNAMQLGPDGCLYYPHMLTGQVWRVPPDGGPTELVAEDVHEPVAVRFDQGGVLLVLSRGVDGIVTRIDLHGTGARSQLTSGLVGLDNAAFDAENRMYVSSYASGGVTELHPDGRTRELVRRGMDGPFGVTVDLGGSVYAADHYRLAAPERSAGPGTTDVATRLLRPFAHGLAADGELLHLTSQYGRVETHDPATGTTTERASGLARPTGLAVAPDGALVVAESGAGRVVAVQPTVDDGELGSGSRDGAGAGSSGASKSAGSSDGAETLAVLAEGLDRPVDVAFDESGRCYVSDEAGGALLRLDPAPEVADAAPEAAVDAPNDAAAGGSSAAPTHTPVTLVDGLEAPQGITVLDGELYAVETGRSRLVAVSLTTGALRVEASNLAVGTPPRAGAPAPALFAHGMPGLPSPFAGLAAAPDGTLLLSANGEGTVQRFTPGGAESSGGDADTQ